MRGVAEKLGEEFPDLSPNRRGLREVRPAALRPVCLRSCRRRFQPKMRRPCQGLAGSGIGRLRCFPRERPRDDRRRAGRNGAGDEILPVREAQSNPPWHGRITTDSTQFSPLPSGRRWLENLSLTFPQ